MEYVDGVNLNVNNINILLCKFIIISNYMRQWEY